MDIDIRRACNDDIDRIEQLLEQVRAVHHDIRPDLFRDNGVKYGPDKLKRMISDNRYVIFSSHDDNGLVEGYTICIVQEHLGDGALNDLKTLYIDDLCVDERCRGKHIGKRLYEHVLEYARDNGFYNVTLNAWNGNDRAVEFYEGCGMKVQKYGMEVIL